MPRAQGLRLWFFALITMLCQFALWMLLSASLKLYELSAAFLCSALAAVGATVFNTCLRQRYLLIWRSMKKVSSAPWYMFSDSMRILYTTTAALLLQRPIASTIRTVENAVPRSGTPSTAALLTFCATLPPNSVVLGLVDDRHLILHQLVSAELSPIVRRFGATHE